VGFSWSRVWRTAPVGPPQPDYLNAVVAFQVGGLLEPTDLLAVLQGLEAGAGRQRQVRWGPRTLDLDVILWGLRVVAQPGLSVPHPRAHLRGFVLWPLLDVWPGAVIPGWGDARVLARGLGLEGCAPVLDQGAWAPVAAPTPTFTSRS
jgi:2-amino-4-hydroxy-6-hydroxymethyldihydropteridine diphosphokinase